MTSTAMKMDVETVMTYQEWERIHNRRVARQTARLRAKTIKFLQQKLMGLGMIAISIIFPLINDGDATASLLTLPLGIWMLFSREMVIY